LPHRRRARRVWASGAEDLGESHHALRAWNVSQDSAGSGFGLFDTMTTSSPLDGGRRFVAYAVGYGTDLAHFIRDAT